MKAISAEDSRQVRWHPAMTTWCLHLNFLSSSAYHALRSSGVIKIPSKRTLSVNILTGLELVLAFWMMLMPSL